MMGIPQQFFQVSAKYPVCKDRLTMLVMAGKSESKHADNKEAGIGSKMQDVLSRCNHMTNCLSR